MKKIFIVASVIILFIPQINLADPICSMEPNQFIGWPKLIEMADAIVILRIEQNLSDSRSRNTFYSEHECFIYQTLKGDLKKNSRVRLMLYDLEGSFTEPYSTLSNHLVFLVKKEQDDESTDYRMLTLCGAQTLLSPFGLEKMPEGQTLEEIIKNLIQSSIDYQDKKHKKLMNFLNSIMRGPNEYNIKRKYNRLDHIQQVTHQ